MMKMSDSREIKADRATVWEALLSPDVLRDCIPGAQEVTGSPEKGFDASVVQKISSVKATFKGRLAISNMNEPESLTLSGEGKGGAAGFAKGAANIRLEEIEGGTRLHYEVEASVGGKLAQLGSRIVDGFVMKMADQFFARLEEVIEGPQAPETAPDGAEEGAPGGRKKGWFRKLVS